MAITAKDVKELRDRTDAPMMECKAALESAGGNMDAAIKILRERGAAKMAKRADRETAEGLVRLDVGAGNRGGTAVVVSCETDFAAKNEAFVNLADSVLAAAKQLPPKAASVDAVLDAKAQDGRTVKSHLEDAANAIRENMAVRQVIRFEGITGAYEHYTKKSGAMIEVELGDPSKANSEAITSLLKELCMHVVSVDPAPIALLSSEIPPSVIDAEREIYIKQAMETGKPKEIAEKIVTGQLKKFLATRALVEQPFIRDDSQTVAAYANSKAKALSAGSLKITRFARLKIGE